ncbi:short-chain dehydrogenase [Beauveria bassiana ARSEF 2860]|uniref:Short-chain dehydrogenase n=1 Tax=Beauveria bassiana (strain ARSEF 2860) TaxID=655819 RepID=J5JKE0_BEAB2|nr:short-chain dehydrogenase [Beauveria bassiana ARSEF 2860]EJP63706.1 short-chain dehydrogenase [Beauveria bassiana ARSEF 2860]
MVAVANGAIVHDGGASSLPTTLSTLPGPNHDWSVTLKDKVIAITGANQGIGLALAEVCLANDAASVFSLDISVPAESFADLEKCFPGKLEFWHCDVTKEESVQAALDAIVAKKKRFDGMIANAGATKHQPALDFTMDQVKRLFELNVYGSWNCATAAARTFIKLGCKGSIVFTASMTSYRPNRAAPSAPYGATKGAVRNMTHTLAMEWAQYGIRVNSISPGFVKTALTYYIEKDPEWGNKMKNYGGMPRLALPQELGGAYVYLLSETSTYTTGIDIPIAGIVGAW